MSSFAARTSATHTRASDATQGPRPVRLTVVVVSYETRELTLDCLASLFDQTSTPMHVVVVDNASTDGSADAIARRFPQVELLAESANHGFAAANVLGARRGEGDLLLLLNPDTVVLDRAVDRLVRFATEHPSAGIWGGRTVFPDGSLNPASCWRRMTPWSVLCRLLGLDTRFPASTLWNGEGYGGWERDTERDVDIVSGCFLLVRRDLWERLGGLDRSFVMYGEEADLCLRARPLGARPRITPTATIVHLGGASERVRSEKLIKLLSAKIALARRHERGLRRHAIVWLLRAWPALRLFAARSAVVVGRSSTARDELATRRSIWSHRREWWSGYPIDPELQTTTPTGVIG